MKYWLIAILSVIVFFAVACDSDNTSYDSEVATGKLIINIAGNNNITNGDSTRSLTPQEAASVADTYTVYVWNDKNKFSASSRESDDGSIPEINLPVGEYSVTVLAGVWMEKDAVLNVTSAHPAICGVGSTSVTIIPSETTEATVILDSISMEISNLPESAGVGDLITVTASIDFKDSHLKNYADMFVIYKDGEYFSRITTSPNALYTSASSSAVISFDQTGTYTIQFGPWGIRFYDNGEEVFGTNYTLGPIGIPEYDKFFEEKQITIFPQSSNLSVSVQWKN